MVTQEQVRGLEDGERAGAGPQGWDAALGSAYARFASRPIAHNAGRFVVALLLALLLTAKWKTLSTMLADDQLGAGGTDWALLLNNALQIPFLALATLLVVIRGPQIRGTGRFSGVVVALSGTLIPSLLIYDSGARSDASLAAVAALLLLGGMIWAVWSLAVLGRCFAMVPEVRGLVTRGPYRWVRHPIYLGEVVATLGLLLPILSVFHIAIFAAFLGLQLWRTKYEEAGLSATFPEYRAYRSRTARLVPGLW